MRPKTRRRGAAAAQSIFLNRGRELRDDVNWLIPFRGTGGLEEEMSVEA